MQQRLLCLLSAVGILVHAGSMDDLEQHVPYLGPSGALSKEESPASPGYRKGFLPTTSTKGSPAYKKAPTLPPLVGILEPQQCQDLTWSDVRSSDKKARGCAEHAVWARDRGLKAQPDYYKPYENLKQDSSFGDLQCMLFYKTQEEDILKSDWECPYPCTEPKLEFEGGWTACPDSALDKSGALDIVKLDAYIRKGAAKLPEGINDREMVTILHNAGAARMGPSKKMGEAEAGGLSPWVWAGGAIALAGVAAAGVAYSGVASSFFQAKAPQTKRGLMMKKVAVAGGDYSQVAAAPAAGPATFAAPAGSMYTATAPVMTTPIRQYAPGGSVSGAPIPGFDAIDRNHDGVITRAEFQQAMAVRQ